MVHFATNDNDKTVAEAYRAYAAGMTLRLYAMHPAYILIENAAYEELETIALTSVVSAAQPTIGAPTSFDVPTVGTVWGLPIRGWSMHNGSSADVQVVGLVVVDELRERVLYLRRFSSTVLLDEGDSVAFDLDLWFDTTRSLV